MLGAQSLSDVASELWCPRCEAVQSDEDSAPKRGSAASGEAENAVCIAEAQRVDQEEG